MGLERISYPTLDGGELEDTLNTAFAEDLLFEHAIRDPRRQNRLRQWWHKTFLGYGLKYGEVYTPVGNRKALAIWLGPKTPIVSTWKSIPMGMYKAPCMFRPAEFLRMLNTVNAIQELQKRQPDPHFYYLMMLAVHPSQQGKGLGEVLLNTILTRADAEHKPCYLETSKEKNVAYYQSFGFQVFGHGKLTQAGHTFPYWGMIRPAH